MSTRVAGGRRTSLSKGGPGQSCCIGLLLLSQHPFGVRTAPLDRGFEVVARCNRSARRAATAPSAASQHHHLRDDARARSETGCIHSGGRAARILVEVGILRMVESTTQRRCACSPPRDCNRPLTTGRRRSSAAAARRRDRRRQSQQLLPSSSPRAGRPGAGAAASAGRGASRGTAWRPHPSLDPARWPVLTKNPARLPLLVSVLVCDVP